MDPGPECLQSVGIHFTPERASRAAVSLSSVCVPLVIVPLPYIHFLAHQRKLEGTKTRASSILRLLLIVEVAVRSLQPFLDMVSGCDDGVFRRSVLRETRRYRLRWRGVRSDTGCMAGSLNVLTTSLTS